jgi:hypothetical protein
MAQQGANWAGQGLDLFKLQLHEPEEKVPAKKANVRDSKLKKGKPTPQRSASKTESAKDPMEEAQNAAPVKIQTVWNRCRVRTRNTVKFFAVNKWRAALNLFAGMCVVESDQPATSTMSQQSERPTTRKQLQKPKSHGKDKRPANEKAVVTPEQSLAVVLAFSRGDCARGSRQRPGDCSFFCLSAGRLPSLVGTRLHHIFCGQHCIATNF